jgi:hypothetical protein
MYHDMTWTDIWQITSRFDGVIKKLYYEPDDMAKVGKVRGRLFLVIKYGN